MNRCWIAGRVVAVKRKYGLTVDAREARALEGVLSGCASIEMVVAKGQEEMAQPTPNTAALSTGGALSRWDTNGNGRITCREAREHGIAPVGREHPACPCGTGMVQPESCVMEAAEQAKTRAANEGQREVHGRGQGNAP